MPRLAGDDLGHRHALVLGLVGEHRARDRIADGMDSLDRGSPVRIGPDLAALARLHPQRIEAQPVDERLATGRDQHGVGLDAVFAVVLAQLETDRGLAPGDLHALHRGAEREFQALLGEQFLERLLHLAIHARSDRVEIFDHLHLGTEAGIDRPDFKPDDAGADHHEVLRDLAELERAGRAHHRLFVDLDAGQPARLQSRWR